MNAMPGDPTKEHFPFRRESVTVIEPSEGSQAWTRGSEIATNLELRPVACVNCSLGALLSLPDHGHLTDCSAQRL
jgi:hypothetical protein